MTRNQFFTLWQKAGSGQLVDLVSEHFPVEFAQGSANCMLVNGDPRAKGAKNPYKRESDPQFPSPRAIAWNVGWQLTRERFYGPIQIDDLPPFDPNIHAQIK